MLAFVTHSSRSRQPGRIAPRPAALSSGQRGLGDISIASELFQNAMDAGSQQAAGPIMNPALSVSSGLPWAFTPLMPGAPGGSGGITEIALGTSSGCDCGGSCGCGDSHTPGLFGLPWWVWAAGVGIVAYEGKGGR